MSSQKKSKRKVVDPDDDLIEVRHRHLLVPSRVVVSILTGPMTVLLVDGPKQASPKQKKKRTVYDTDEDVFDSAEEMKVRPCRLLVPSSVVVPILTGAMIFFNSHSHSSTT